MLIITNKPGYLANLLFLFANFIACASENNLTIAYPAFDDYAPFFQTTSDDLFCRYPARKSLVRGNKSVRRLLYQFSYYLTRIVVRSGLRANHFLKAIALDWDEEVRLDSAEFLSSIKKRRIVLLQGWLFRDRSHVRKHADAIRNFFRPVQAIEDNVSALIERARTGCDVLVGVHLRQGDYKTFEGGRYFYEVSQYREVMKKIEDMFPGRRVGFVICSNVKQSAEDFKGFTFTFGTNHLVEDLYAFARCDYIVGPPSTYTMWASFYGQVPLCMLEDIEARELRFDDTQSFLSAAT